MKTKIAYSVPLLGALVSTPAFAAEPQTNTPAYCTDAVKVDVPKGKTAWALTSEYVLGHPNKGLDETLEGRRMIAKELMVGGRIYECTLANAVASSDSGLVEKVKNSDTVYVTVNRDADNKVTGFQTVAGHDKILLDNISTIYVPKDMFTAAPASVQAAAADGYLSLSDWEKWKIEQRALDCDQYARLDAMDRKGVPDACKEAVVLPDTVPAPVAPASTPAVAREALLPDNFVAGGLQYIAEGGAAPLAGPGLTTEARFSIPLNENGAIVFDVDHMWLAGLKYNDGSGNVTLGDADLSALYMHRVGPNARIGGGLNLDARTAGATYAGINASTGQWAVGPEVVYQFDNGQHAVQIEGSLGWGNVNADVDMPGYNSTNDGLSKAKLGAEYTARVGEKWQLGAEFDVESDTGARSTQDAGARHWNDTRLSVGPTVQRDLGKGWAVRCEPSLVYSTVRKLLPDKLKCL